MNGIMDEISGSGEGKDIVETFQTSLAFKREDDAKMDPEPQAQSLLASLKHTPPSFYDDLRDHEHKKRRARLHSPMQPVHPYQPNMPTTNPIQPKSNMENANFGFGHLSAGSRKAYGGLVGNGAGAGVASLPATPDYGQAGGKGRYGAIAGPGAPRVAEAKRANGGEGAAGGGHGGGGGRRAGGWGVDAGKISNSTSTIFASSTINNPDADQIILCMAAVLQIQMAHDLDAPLEMRAPFSAFEQEGEGSGWTDLEEAARVEPPPDPAKKGTPEEDLPSIDEIYMFINGIFTRAKFSPECNIIGLVYINRVISNSRIPLVKQNWKPLILASLILAQKIWDDKCLATSNFALICPRYSKRQVKFFEIKFLELLQYQATVTQSLYAKYYFELRELFEQLMREKRDELRAFPLQPLPLWRARQLEIYSDRFRLQQRGGGGGEGAPGGGAGGGGGGGGGERREYQRGGEREGRAGVRRPQSAGGRPSSAGGRPGSSFLPGGHADGGGALAAAAGLPPRPHLPSRGASPAGAGGRGGGGGLAGASPVMSPAQTLEDVTYTPKGRYVQS